MLALQQIVDRLLEHRFRPDRQLFTRNDVVALGVRIEGRLKIATLARVTVLGSLARQTDAVGAAAPGATLMLVDVGAFGILEPVGGTASERLHDVCPFR